MYWTRMSGMQLPDWKKIGGGQRRFMDVLKEDMGMVGVTVDKAGDKSLLL